MSYKKFLRVLAFGTIILGIVLLLSDFVGLFYHTSVKEGDKNVLDKYPRTVTEKDFWVNAYRKPQEDIDKYVVRLCDLVSKRMLLINPKYTKPTFFENWILWLWAQKLGYYEYIDTRKAVRLGGGFCSQHAIVFNNILQEQGIVSRILGLGGHVLNEVLLKGKWRVCDPDYSIVFDESLCELERRPWVVFKKYKGKGLSDSEAEYIVKIFTSAEDNWCFQNSSVYDVKRYLIERASFYLIWVIPIGMILLGLFLW